MNGLRSIPVALVAWFSMTGCADGLPTELSGGFGNPAPQSALPLQVLIDGPTVVSTKGLYRWTARVAGGNGSHAYRWEVRDPTGAASDDVLEGRGRVFEMVVGPGDREVEVHVVVTSGARTASASLRIVPEDPGLPTLQR